MVLRRSVWGGIPLILAAGCDLLNQTPIVDPIAPSERIAAPLNLSKPDSVLKMIGYIFDQHTPQSAQDFGDILYKGYVYRYDGPGDDLDLELDRASEIRVYENIFSHYENIEAQFVEEMQWTEYGIDNNAPDGTLPRHISAEHPAEDWVVIRVSADMSFTYSDQYGQQAGYIVRQRFDMAFRVAAVTPDSVWQLASWTDRESQISVKRARAD